MAAPPDEAPTTAAEPGGAGGDRVGPNLMSRPLTLQQRTPTKKPAERAVSLSTPTAPLAERGVGSLRGVFLRKKRRRQVRCMPRPPSSVSVPLATAHPGCLLRRWECLVVRWRFAQIAWAKLRTVIRLMAMYRRQSAAAREELRQRVFAIARENKLVITVDENIASVPVWKQVPPSRTFETSCVWVLTTP